MDALLFTSPAVPTLPALHPLECPLASARIRSTWVLDRAHVRRSAWYRGRGAHEDEDEDSSNDPSAAQRLSRMTHDGMLHDVRPVLFENVGCGSRCHPGQPLSEFPVSQWRELPATPHPQAGGCSHDRRYLQTNHLVTNGKPQNDRATILARSDAVFIRTWPERATTAQVRRALRRSQFGAMRPIHGRSS